MKELKDLTLLDKFLFDEAMEDPQVYEAMLQIILDNEDLKLLGIPETEKEIRTTPWLKNIRVDIFAMDSEHTIYNSESQKRNTKDLIRRSRYYQSLIDSSLLETGNRNYNQLNNTVIILITPFDLFGKNRYIYTFEGYCKEDPSIKINDGGKRIFINTHGTNTDEVSPALVELCKLIEYNEINQNISEKISQLDIIANKIQAIKQSEKVGVLYMQKWEEEALIREDGYNDGLEKGRELGRNEGIELGRNEGMELGRSEGIELGRNEGITSGQKTMQQSIVKNMIATGFTDEDIAKACNISIEEVAKISH